MIYTIDRIESNVLVLEDENDNIINYELSNALITSLNLKSGDIISIDKHGEINVLDDCKEERTKFLSKKIKDLWNY